MARLLFWPELSYTFIVYGVDYEAPPEWTLVSSYRVYASRQKDVQFFEMGQRLDRRSRGQLRVDFHTPCRDAPSFRYESEEVHWPSSQIGIAIQWVKQ